MANVYNFNEVTQGSPFFCTVIWKSGDQLVDVSQCQLDFMVQKKDGSRVLLIHHDPGEYVLDVDTRITLTGLGQMVIYINPNTTRNLQPGKYTYVLLVTFFNDDIRRILSGNFNVISMT
jgi:hypothetical protein